MKLGALGLATSRCASSIPLPVLTSSRVSLEGLSGQIDADVRELLKSALAVYEVQGEKLRRVWYFPVVKPR